MEYELRKALLKSIEKNGNQPLTTQHLLNIVNLIIKKDGDEQDRLDQLLGECLNDF